VQSHFRIQVLLLLLLVQVLQRRRMLMRERLGRMWVCSTRWARPSRRRKRS
jgi:hypothetical protein